MEYNMTDKAAPVGTEVPNDSASIWEKVKALHHSGTDQLASLDKDTVRDPSTGRIIGGPTGGDWDPKLKPDQQTKVFFGKQRVFSPFETVKNGEPTWIIQDFITIIPPRINAEGKPQTKDYKTINAQVTERDKWRFPNEWKAYSEGRQTVSATTPLAQWHELAEHAAVIDELRAIQVLTVEDLASTGDTAGGKYVKDFVKWKEKAKAFISDKNKPVALTNVESQLEKMQKQHAAEMAALLERINQMEGKKASKKNEAE